MFRLNHCLGLPVVAHAAENSQEISNACGEGAHLDFPGNMRASLHEKTHALRVFFRTLNAVVLFPHANIPHTTPAFFNDARVRASRRAQVLPLLAV